MSDDFAIGPSAEITEQAANEIIDELYRLYTNANDLGTAADDPMHAVGYAKGLGAAHSAAVRIRAGQRKRNHPSTWIVLVTREQKQRWLEFLRHEHAR